MTDAKEDRSPTASSLRAAAKLGAPIERQHASDRVFKDVASAILRRELAPGSALPPERELSERFGVSRIVVREAVHRLKEYELVRVRQGSPTVVLDPDRATDIRLLGLEIHLVPDGEEMRAVYERQNYSAASLLELAEQRMVVAEVEELERVVDDFLALAEYADRVMEFERRYWTAVARGTRNRIILRETLWWLNVLEREPALQRAAWRDHRDRWKLYKALIPAQRARSGAAAMFLSALRAADTEEAG